MTTKVATLFTWHKYFPKYVMQEDVGRENAKYSIKTPSFDIDIMSKFYFMRENMA